MTEINSISEEEILSIDIISKISNKNKEYLFVWLLDKKYRLKHDNIYIIYGMYEDNKYINISKEELSFLTNINESMENNEIRNVKKILTDAETVIIEEVLNKGRMKISVVILGEGGKELINNIKEMAEYVYGKIWPNQENNQ